MAPQCELCDEPAAWKAYPATGRPAFLCRHHQHAAAAELGPPCDDERDGPEKVGEIAIRLLQRLSRPGHRKYLRPFRADL